jgi:hypothetical protein
MNIRLKLLKKIASENLTIDEFYSWLNDKLSKYDPSIQYLNQQIAILLNMDSIIGDSEDPDIISNEIKQIVKQVKQLGWVVVEQETPWNTKYNLPLCSNATC